MVVISQGKELKCELNHNWIKTYNKSLFKPAIMTDLNSDTTENKFYEGF